MRSGNWTFLLLQISEIESLRPPETPREQQQNGENLQTTHHHVEREQPFGGIGNVVEIAARSRDA